MLSIFAKSFEYTNGTCIVDGIVQSGNDACTGAAITVVRIISIFIIPLLVIGLALFAFWIMMLVHALKTEDLKDRNLWLAVLIGSVLASSGGLVAIAYYFLAKRPYDSNGANSEDIRPDTKLTKSS